MKAEGAEGKTKKISMSKKQQSKIQTPVGDQVHAQAQPQDSEVQNLQQHVEDLTNSWKRALADYKNLESRVERQRLESVLYATRTLILRLLKILDDLDRALVHHQDDWIRLMRTELFGILSGEGVTEISVEGEVFNPTTMECVSQAAGEKDKVIKVLSKGYKLHDQILRPAKVEVGSGHSQGS